MEVMGSNTAARLTVWQVYLCQKAWDLVSEICLQKAAEALLVSGILMENFNGRGTQFAQDGFDFKVGTGFIEMIGKSPRSEELAKCSSLIEALTKYAEVLAQDATFLDGPDTNIRVPNTIKTSMAAKNKDEGGSEDDKDEDDEDDDNEDDFGEDGEEDVSSEDGEDKNGDAPGGGGGGGGDEEDDDEEDEEDANNGNNGSGDDEDDEDDEEEDEHVEGEEEEDEDEDEEDEDDEETLHPPKKRKK